MKLSALNVIIAVCLLSISKAGVASPVVIDFEDFDLNGEISQSFQNSLVVNGVNFQGHKINIVKPFEPLTPNLRTVYLTAASNVTSNFEILFPYPVANLKFNTLADNVEDMGVVEVYDGTDSLLGVKSFIKDNNLSTKELNSFTEFNGITRLRIMQTIGGFGFDDFTFEPAKQNLLLDFSNPTTFIQNVVAKDMLTNTPVRGATATFSPRGGVVSSDQQVVVNVVQAAFDKAGANVNVSKNPSDFTGEESITSKMIVGGNLSDLKFSSPNYIYGGSSSALGFAPVNIGNTDSSDIGYVFPLAFTDPDLIPGAIAHEAGHLFGISHIDGKGGIMESSAQSIKFPLTFSKKAEDCLKVNINGEAGTCSVGGSKKSGKLTPILGTVDVDTIYDATLAIPIESLGGHFASDYIELGNFVSGVSTEFDVPFFDGDAFLFGRSDPNGIFDIILNKPFTNITEDYSSEDISVLSFSDLTGPKSTFSITQITSPNSFEKIGNIISGVEDRVSVPVSNTISLILLGFILMLFSWRRRF